MERIASRTFAYRRRSPEIEEIEPIIRIAAAIALENGSVALNRGAHRRFPAAGAGLRKVRDGDEGHMISIPATVQTDHEKYRAAQNRRRPHGPRRKMRGMPEELHRLRGFVPQRTIGE